jgi:hypothetical protein
MLIAMSSITKLHEAARWYVDHGIPVFPLCPRSKKPITEHGFKNASVDPHRVGVWWTEHPDANVAIPMGELSRLLLLDLDYRNGSVVEDRADLIRLYGPIPDTAEVISGGGGRHIYFRHAGGKVPKQLAKGIELKGEGGYAVAPPSVHPSGDEYAFDGTDGAKALLNVADPPEWLLAAIAKAAHRAKSDASTDQWPEGERNTRLTSLAGRLRRGGLGVDAIAAALLAENRRRCIPPLDDAEVHRIARSIGRYAPGSASHTLHVDASAVPTSLDLLNAVELFQGRIRFTWLRRRGSIIQAGFADGREAQWNSATDIRTFTRSQDVLLDATGFLIPSPPVKSIKRIWEPVAQLIRSIADQDATDIGPPLKDEFEQIIRATWVRAGRPEARDRGQFFAILRECQQHKRDHTAEHPPRCCVWISEGWCWIYQDALLEWLSTPVAKSKHYPWNDVRTALLLLDFQPRELHRSLRGERVHVRIWKGPLALLVDDDTVEESDL